MGVSLTARFARIALVAALSLLAAACGSESTLQSLVSAEDRDYALKIMRAVQTGDAATAIEHMPAATAARMGPRLPQMRTALPPDLAATPRLVAAKITLLSAARRSQVAYAFDGDTPALVRMVIVRGKDHVALTVLEVSRLTAPVDTLTQPFALTGKSGGQYIFLTLAVLSASTILASLYVLYRAKDVTRKWLWAIGCLLGYGQVTMDWTTGAVWLNTLSVQVLGVVVTKATLFGPWYIGVGFPLVAYIFLLTHLKPRTSSVLSTSPSSTSS